MQAKPRLLYGICLAICLVAPGLAAPAFAVDEDREVGMSNDEFEKLDTFEAHVLGKADQVFAKKDYKRAAAEYDSFILEFPRSAAIPYALMRKGRSLHRLDKRFEAIREYTQVLDFFPNVVKYAAAAQAYIGWCHWENGDTAKALKAWAKVAADKDYSKQPIAAGGLLHLARHHAREGRFDKAMGYYRTLATHFRKSSRDVANDAIEQAAYHYVRRAPNEPALRELYKNAGTFHHYPRDVEPSVEELLNDGSYWNYVRRYIDQWGDFKETQAQQKQAYYRYWVERMDGRFAGWDDYQIDLANFKLRVEGDRGKWFERLDAQFERKKDEDTVKRIIHWMMLYRGFDQKWKQYYNKLNLSELTNGQLVHLIETLFRHIHADDMGENAFGHINWKKMDDKAVESLRRFFWNESERLYMLTCQHFSNPEHGKYMMLEYHHARREHRHGDRGRHIKEGLELANALVNSPDYAERAIWAKAELLFAAGRWEDAIAAYKQSERMPESLIGIAECQLRLGEPNKAIATLREIENFFKGRASWAAYKIARVYKGIDEKQKYIAELRNIMKKYAGSGEASEAHRELERMGIKIGGYVEAED
mgnify:FL=1